ncbi:MAG: transcriptional regulator [Prevotella sp.]|nr:transcriptional regulator [Prevotella sp.]
MEARVGDNVMISPEVTHKSDWTSGTVIDVEANPFVGTVISAKTADGEIYFEKGYLFKPAV